MSIVADVRKVRRIPRLATQHDRVRVFRRCLEVLAEPGEIADLAPVFADRHGEDGCALTAAPLMVLADPMSSVAAMPQDPDAVADIEIVAALTHAPIADHTDARFVLARRMPEPQAISALYRGTREEPHTAALLVLAVERIGEGDQRLRLSGPGVDGRRDLVVEGPTSALWSARAEAIDFPLGIDVLLVDADGRIAGLPRTTRVEVIS